MRDQNEPYLSYLLRLWMVKNQTGFVWRCSIENVQTGERQGFADPTSLCEFLDEITTLLPDVDLENNDCAV